jgi:AraC-like DNA-binding protein
VFAENCRSYETSATIQCGALSGIDELLKQRDVNAAALFERMGVDPSGLDNPDARIDHRRYVELLESAARVSHDETLGLRLGYQQPLSSLGTLSNVLLGATDIKSAIQAVITHLPMHQEGARLELSLDGEQAVLSYSVRDPGLLEYRQDAELSVARILRFAHAMVGGPRGCAPSAVYFEHPAPRDTSVHRRLFGAPVYFSRGRHGIAFPREFLNQRVTAAVLQGTPTPVLAPSSQTKGPHLDLAGELRLHIVRAMRQGHVSICDCAAAFGLSTRTFQRRLTTAGVLFESLVDSTRYELARIYLKQAHLSLTEIGHLLGYAELSTFSRAFRRWSGCSPQTFRRGHHEQERGVAISRAA